MKRLIIFLIIASFINCGMLSYTAEGNESEYTGQDKFSRGIFNVLTWPFELPITIYEYSVEENPLVGVLYGVPVGIGRAVVRMVTGLVELITFAQPPYGPMVEPEYLFIKKEKID